MVSSFSCGGTLSTLTKRESNLLDVAHAITTSGDASERPALPGVSTGDSIIHIHLGPEQRPEWIHIRRSAWPTATALNHGHDRGGPEFHLRLRRHTKTGVYVVYGSVELPDRTIRQRGHLCRTLDEVKAVMPLLRRELEIPGRSLP